MTTAPSTPSPVPPLDAQSLPPSIDVHVHGPAAVAATADFDWTGWLAGVGSSFFPWPLIFVALLAHPRVRNALIKLLENMSRAKELGVGDFKVSLSEAYQNEGKSSVAVREQLRAHFDRQVDKLKIMKLLQSTIDSAIVPAFDTKHALDYRVTIHVHSVVYDDRLYQLTEYLPRAADVLPKRGRLYSLRYGIIGKAWRSGECEHDPNVEDNLRDLVRFWGMTATEAEEAAKGMKTFLAVPIVDDANNVVAVLFVNARPKAAFRSGDVGTAILDEVERNSLRSKLIELRNRAEAELRST